MNILDNTPIASIAFVLYALAGAYLVVIGTLDFYDYGIALGVGGAGIGVLGEARNRAGKGTRVKGGR